MTREPTLGIVNEVKGGKVEHLGFVLLLVFLHARAPSKKNKIKISYRASITRHSSGSSNGDYLEDFHCLFQLLLVFGSFPPSVESYLQVAHCWSLCLEDDEKKR